MKTLYGIQHIYTHIQQWELTLAKAIVLVPTLTGTSETFPRAISSRMSARHGPFIV